MKQPECGPACIKFAVDNSRLVAGLILFGSLAKGCWAPDYPYALRASQYDAWGQQLVAEWGGPAGIETFAPSLSRDPLARAWWAGLLRAASSPGGIWAVLKALSDTDVRTLLPRVSVPTLVLHRRNDPAVRIEAGRDMASPSLALNLLSSTAMIIGSLLVLSKRCSMQSNDSSTLCRAIGSQAGKPGSAAQAVSITAERRPQPGTPRGRPGDAAVLARH
jgi:hypothetical protein